jgi:hypothetical protein
MSGNTSREEKPMNHEELQIEKYCGYAGFIKSVHNRKPDSTVTRRIL